MSQTHIYLYCVSKVRSSGITRGCQSSHQDDERLAVCWRLLILNGLIIASQIRSEDQLCFILKEKWLFLAMSESSSFSRTSGRGVYADCPKVTHSLDTDLKKYASTSTEPA